MATDDALRELAALYPASKKVSIAGREIEIRRSGIRHGSQVVQMGMSLALLMGDDDEVLFVDEHPQDAADLLVLATGVDKEWALSLDAVDKIDLATEWLEVNGRFFLQRLPQARARLRANVSNFIGAGTTQSTTSSGTDTPAPTTTRPKRSSSTPKQPRVLYGANGSQP